ncbi:hypothetical protein LX32DRAFT_9191 [Colletotrichum zoysiae]|uniref:Uncharacterized protein n=1 Tax=Colletotrichum zoysiae TaxID=1216348 RepID=A0AAD9HET6_9PEZI|nr:hypothetical protein LX32DRAFT_9191 [Colletotrichum zoysiae]
MCKSLPADLAGLAPFRRVTTTVLYCLRFVWLGGTLLTSTVLRAGGCEKPFGFVTIFRNRHGSFERSHGCLLSLYSSVISRWL